MPSAPEDAIDQPLWPVNGEGKLQGLSYRCVDQLSGWLACQRKTRTTGIAVFLCLQFRSVVCRSLHRAARVYILRWRGSGQKHPPPASLYRVGYGSPAGQPRIWVADQGTAALVLAQCIPTAHSEGGNAFCQDQCCSALVLGHCTLVGRANPHRCNCSDTSLLSACFAQQL